MRFSRTASIAVLLLSTMHGVGAPSVPASEQVQEISVAHASGLASAPLEGAEPVWQPRGYENPSYQDASDSSEGSNEWVAMRPEAHRACEKQSCAHWDATQNTCTVHVPTVRARPVKDMFARVWGKVTRLRKYLGRVVTKTRLKTIACGSLLFAGGAFARHAAGWAHPFEPSTRTLGINDTAPHFGPFLCTRLGEQDLSTHLGAHGATAHTVPMHTFFANCTRAVKSILPSPYRKVLEVGCGPHACGQHLSDVCTAGCIAIQRTSPHSFTLSPSWLREPIGVVCASDNETLPRKKHKQRSKSRTRPHRRRHEKIGGVK